jgi:hypothetical protein
MLAQDDSPPREGSSQLVRLSGGVAAAFVLSEFGCSIVSEQ